MADHAERAVRMAVAVRERLDGLIARWRRSGFDLHVGIGIAQGFASIGAIGFEGRWDYSVIGTVANLAARLCGEARSGQILVSQPVHAAVEGICETEPLPPLTLKGFQLPVTASSVLGIRT